MSRGYMKKLAVDLVPGWRDQLLGYIGTELPYLDIFQLEDEIGEEEEDEEGGDLYDNIHAVVKVMPDSTCSTLVKPVMFSPKKDGESFKSKETWRQFVILKVLNGLGGGGVKTYKLKRFAMFTEDMSKGEKKDLLRPLHLLRAPEMKEMVANLAREMAKRGYAGLEIVQVDEDFEFEMIKREDSAEDTFKVLFKPYGLEVIVSHGIVMENLEDVEYKKVKRKPINPPHLP